MQTYEEQLASNHQLAFHEGSMHFENESGVHRTLRRICERLDELGVAYNVVGGMAMFFHGYRRFTEDVDLLVTADGLKHIQEKLVGRGYLPPFEGSRNLRDTETGVRIEFLITGDFPGDGKPKPVAFPDPNKTSIEIDGVTFISLVGLLELKLASGLTNPRRARDLADVQELIATLKLQREFADQLDESVREKYLSLWQIVHDYPE
ncbi:MAG: hypothetical protein KDA80_04005 [Planctomycetaceae bacterium]|nr:hypothetical protein [Planctomycetaceae bacterium]MCA9070745.1 hypothetical protein [Planctomycetaceae bacterium]